MDWLGFFYALTAEYSSDSVPMSDLIGVYRETCGGGNPTNCNNNQTFFGLLNHFKNEFWENNPDAINYWNFLAVEYGVNN